MESARPGVHALTPRLRAVPRSAPIRVFLLDPYSLMRHGLRVLLSSEGDLEVVGEADGGGPAVEEVAATRPDVVLMDVAAPGAGGVEAIRAIKARRPATAVLVLTLQSDQERFREAAEAGAVGYVLKDISPANLCNAIRAVHRGATMINPVLARQMVESLSQEGAAVSGIGSRRPRRLTPRATEILIEVARGLSDKEIAAKLGLSESRVKNCLRAVYGTFRLRNRAHAAAFAVRRGLL
ncbi:MAG TPA: response regulator transcription factor [bacterium]|nr:response regulator transcription factor [bacterium]